MHLQVVQIEGYIPGSIKVITVSSESSRLTHTPVVHLEQEPYSKRQDSNGNSHDCVRSVRGASVGPRVDGGEAGHRPPYRAPRKFSDKYKEIVAHLPLKASVFLKLVPKRWFRSVLFPLLCGPIIDTTAYESLHSPNLASFMKLSNSETLKTPSPSMSCVEKHASPISDLKPKVIGIRLQSFACLQHSLKAKWDKKLILRV